MENPDENHQDEVREEVSVVSEESQRVDDITIEPEAVVEREMDVEQAEALQIAFTAIVDSSVLAGGEQVSATPLPIPNIAEAVEAALVEAVDASVITSEETVDSTKGVSIASPVETSAGTVEVEIVQEMIGREHTVSEDAEVESVSRQTKSEDGTNRESEDESTRDESGEDDGTLGDVELQVLVQESIEEKQQDEDDNGVVETILVTDVEFSEEEGEGLSEVVASQADQGSVVDTRKAYTQGELEEIWTPPKMYMHVAGDGTKTIVDAEGNTLDSPPLYQLVYSGGTEHILAKYITVSGKEHKFEISFYNIPLEGMKAHYGADGTIKVVDKEGNVLKSPPIITNSMDGSGVEHVYAQYPGMGSTQKVKLEAYSAPIDSDGVFAYMGKDGKIQIVDHNGKPMALPPMVTGYVNYVSGEKYPVVNYVGGGGVGLQKETQLSWYQSPLDDLLVHAGQDGSYTVVDRSGKAVDSPPVINKFLDSMGVEHLSASYQGIGEESVKGELQLYTASLEGLFIYEGSNNITTVVDKNGKAIDSPPIINKVMSGKGTVEYLASYPGVTGEAIKGTLTSYTAPIQDMYAHVGQDGTITVVDADGEPVDSPPIINKVMSGKGTVEYLASYPGDPTGTKPVTLSYYVPPSST